MWWSLIDKLKLLRGDDVVINDNIIIHHPTLNEIYEYGEADYFQLVSLLLATPYDYKVQLWDAGVDYEVVPPFELFFTLVKEIPVNKSKILFGELNFSQFEYAQNTQNNQNVMINLNNKCVIDVAIQKLIIDTIKTMHMIKKEERIFGNKETKDYEIKRERIRQNRLKNKPFESNLISSVSSLVNSSGFKYDYQSVWDLPIYQFNDALSRINHIRYCDNVLTGIYTGNIDGTKINNENINWATNL